MWKKVVQKEAWNQTISAQAHGRFLQSWEWGEFQILQGKEVVRLSWKDKYFVQAFRHSLPLNKSYWYVPHAPIVSEEQDDILEALRELETILCDASALFTRVDPVRRFPSATPHTGLRFVSSTQPQCTSVLSLAPSADALLSAMHQKTRYNIRLAEKKGVTVSDGSIEDFITLNSETTARDGFVSHQDAYYRAMVSLLPNNMVRVLSAEYEGAIIASSIVFSFGDTVTYVHGASSNRHRDVMAPYVLQWHAIQAARTAGARYYDFWGMNPDDRKHAGFKKSWEGITRFKKGFHGEPVCYPQSFDLINTKSWYTLYTLFRRIRSLV